MTLQLRSHIGIAAPARREAADGTEPRLRAVYGFEPKWFHARCGLEFGERWHRDPLYRRETLAAMRDELLRAFPGVCQWSGDEARWTNTIAGAYGTGVMPALFGRPLRYYPDRWPHPEPGHELSDDEIARLDVERMLASEFVESLLAQVETLGATGPVYGDLNWQGVLNLAFHLRGQRIFLDMVESPDLAARLFEVITESIVRLAQMVQARQRAAGCDIDLMCVSNCTLSMISPRMYERSLRTFDERIAHSFARFGVHTCNWDATPYLNSIAALTKAGYIDMGIATDMARARDMFPNARRAVLYTPGDLRDKPVEAVRADVERIARELAPCDIVVADIPWDTPDGAVERFEDICQNTA
jgi:hypothetical protein